jgi:hypothetical protein
MPIQEQTGLVVVRTPVISQGPRAQPPFQLTNNPVKSTLLVFLTGYNYTSGSTWNDLSSYGRNATLQNGSATKNGAANALYFSSPTWWTFPNVGISNKWTCIIWCKISSLSTGCLLSQTFSNGVSFNLVFGNAQSNNGFSFYNNGWATGTSVTITSSSYQCFTGTYDGSSLKTYINGSLAGTTTVGTAVDAGTVYRIGRRWDVSGYITGYIGEIRIYSEVFDASKVMDDYTNTSSVRPYS